MILINGFWTGLFVGFLLGIFTIIFVGLLVTLKEEKTKRMQVDLIDKLHQAVQDKVKEWDSDENSNN